MSVVDFATRDVTQDTLRRLLTKLDNQLIKVTEADEYYAGTQPLSFLAPEISAQVGERLSSAVINWPRTIVDSVQRRSYVEGFRLGRDQEADEDLWAWWQANDLDEWSQLGQVDALVHGRSFLSVWSNEEDESTPRISVESAQQVVVDYAPGTRTVRAAAKRWQDDSTVYATLYLPDVIYRYSAKGTIPYTAPWTLLERIDNPLGVVPVIPLVNRPRVLNLDGTSELTDVMPLADMVNKLATDMMTVSEFFAMPRRWAIGLEIPGTTGPMGPVARDRMEEEVKRFWDNIEKNKTMLGGKGVQFGQFQEATLDNFVKAIGMLTGQIAAISGLPPHYLGINTDNPASAEAIRSAESTLVERAEEKHRGWGGSYERGMRMGVAVRDGIPLAEVPREFRSLETIWRDPRTETKAVDADAAVKLLQAGIIDDVQAQEDIGLGPTQRTAIAERRRKAAETAATADVVSRMNLARELQQRDGLTQNASLAAVGLLVAAGANAAEQQPSPPAQGR